MKRAEFEHVIRAAADIVEDELIVIGSQAILAEHPTAPAALLRSQELDLYPRHEPERAIEIDANIGDGSIFHRTFGYYAHGLGPEALCSAPAGWESRLVKVELRSHRGGCATAWCLSTQDLLVTKLAAGRPGHDLEFVEQAIAAGLASADQLRLGVDLLPTDVREHTRRRLEGIVQRLARAAKSDTFPPCDRIV